MIGTSAKRLASVVFAGAAAGLLAFAGPASAQVLEGLKRQAESAVVQKGGEVIREAIDCAAGEPQCQKSAPSPATPARGEFTATVIPWVTYDDQGGGHVVERGEFVGDAVAWSQPGWAHIRMCDAEEGWFGGIRFANLPEGAASLTVKEYPMNHKPREYTGAALDMPGGSRLVSGSITLDEVGSDAVVGSARATFAGSSSLRLVSGEPPAEYSFQVRFSAPVVPELTRQAAPECFPGSQ